MVSPLTRVLVRTPTTVGNFVEDGFWRQPDTNALLEEHKSLAQLLESLGAQVDIAESLDGLVDSVYMHDPMNDPTWRNLVANGETNSDG